MIPHDPAAEHRVLAATFGARVKGVSPGGWDVPSPVPEWTARDVVRHLLEWFPEFLAAGSEIALADGPSVDDDPVAAWEHRAAAVQSVLDDPATGEVSFAHPYLPEQPLHQAISQFYSADIFMHTWDLARATGQDDHLDQERCQVMFEGMEPMDEVLRQSGQYGPRVPVPDDAGWQVKLLGFIGRDPSWQP